MMRALLFAAASAAVHSFRSISVGRSARDIAAAIADCVQAKLTRFFLRRFGVFVSEDSARILSDV
jgi:uncharacterized protein YqjF (DUF2071 family)